MFDRRSKKGYSRLATDDLDNDELNLQQSQGGANVSLQTPSSLGAYTEKGLEYRDIEDNLIVIPPEKIPDFLQSINSAEIPWTQWTFAAIFFSPKQKAMPGLDLFEQDLAKNPAAMVTYRLMMVSARAGQIQISQVGAERDKILCEDSKALIRLFRRLKSEFEYFQAKIVNLEKDQPNFQLRSQIYRQYEEEFKTTWEHLINPYLEKYRDNLDTRNILLNALSIVSIVGLVGLICKNVVRLYEGKNPSLFQFDAAYSKNIDVVEQLSRPDLPKLKPAIPGIVQQSFFTQNKDDTLKTIDELQKLVNKLDEEITALPPKYQQASRVFRHLHELLAQDLRKLSTDIQSLRNLAAEKQEATRETSEAVFINGWCTSVAMAFGPVESKTEYPPALKKVVDAIQDVTQKLSAEFQDSSRFKLYSSKR